MSQGLGVAGSTKLSTLPASARDSSPALFVPPAAAVTFLAKIEQLPPRATGALRFHTGAREVGSILVEQGRVCWAVAESMRSRLTDLMRHQHQPPLATSRVEAVYRECRKSGVPIGEALVEKGVVTETGLRRALRQHSAEAIAVLSIPDRACSWHARVQSTYDPRFTFSTAELAVSVGALADVESARVARIRLRQAGGALAFGAGFLMVDHDPIPVAEVGGDQFGVADLSALGKWLQAVQANEWLGKPRAVSCLWSSGQTAVGWFEGLIGYAVLCTTAASAAQVMGQVVRQVGAGYGDL